MEKTVIFISIFFIFAIVLAISGCSKGEDNNSAAENANRLNRRPDFGQPERPADVSGLVKSITGNEVTIIKMERPQRPGQTEENSEAGEGRTPSMGFGAGGGVHSMGRRPSGMDEDSRAAMVERMKEMSTGEETVIIPVGIRMLKPDANSEPGSVEMLEATLTDITADKMIQIWLDESVTDRKIASFVLIMR